jgi:hypothetical protein
MGTAMSETIPLYPVVMSESTAMLSDESTVWALLC